MLVRCYERASDDDPSHMPGTDILGWPLLRRSGWKVVPALDIVDAAYILEAVGVHTDDEMDE
eukprot:51867-Eustigmatos_ZCMA.PRE.1